jgi:hypothetical protein
MEIVGDGDDDENQMKISSSNESIESMTNKDRLQQMRRSPPRCSNSNNCETITVGKPPNLREQLMKSNNINISNNNNKTQNETMMSTFTTNFSTSRPANKLAQQQQPQSDLTKADRLKRMLDEERKHLEAARRNFNVPNKDANDEEAEKQQQNASFGFSSNQMSNYHLNFELTKQKSHVKKAATATATKKAEQNSSSFFNFKLPSLNSSSASSASKPPAAANNSNCSSSSKLLKLTNNRNLKSFIKLTTSRDKSLELMKRNNNSNNSLFDSSLNHNNNSNSAADFVADSYSSSNENGIKNVRFSDSISYI